MVRYNYYGAVENEPINFKEKLVSDRAKTGAVDINYL